MTRLHLDFQMWTCCTATFHFQNNHINVKLACCFSGCFSLLWLCFRFFFSFFLHVYDGYLMHVRLWYGLFSSLFFFIQHVHSLSLSSVKSVTDPPSWHQPGSPERKRVPREILRGLNSSPTHTTSTPFHQRGYVRTWRSSKCSVTDSNWASFNLVCVVCSGEADVRVQRQHQHCEEGQTDPERRGGAGGSGSDQQHGRQTDQHRYWQR